MTDRHPLIDREGTLLLDRLLQHPRAPRWNHACGDRLDAAGLERVRAFAARQRCADGMPSAAGPPDWALELAARCRERVPFYRARGGPAARDAASFAELPTCERGDLNRDCTAFVPDGEPLGDLIVYETAGTTGHPVTILSQPLISNLYLALLQSALAARGVTLEGGAGRLAIALVCAQSFTYTYASVSAYLGGAGFVKINLNPLEWRDPSDRATFLDEFEPEIVSGDPLSFLELARLPLAHRPKALVSTSMTLAPGVALQLEGAFGCPVLDLYSLNECRLVAAGAGGRGDLHEIVPHDVYVEVLDDAGRPAADDAHGEVALTCGRNPLLPLVRYRTGDRARLVRRAGRPALAGLEGRAPVVFLDAAGRFVNSIDVSYLLKPFPLARFALRQAADRSLRLAVQGASVDEALLREVLAKPFGGLPLTIERLDAFAPGPAKLVPYAAEVDATAGGAGPAYRALTFREIMNPGRR